MGADKSAENTPIAPKCICPSPKVWDFKKKASLSVRNSWLHIEYTVFLQLWIKKYLLSLLDRLFLVSSFFVLGCLSLENLTNIGDIIELGTYFITYILHIIYLRNLIYPQKRKSCCTVDHSCPHLDFLWRTKRISWNKEWKNC